MLHKDLVLAAMSLSILVACSVDKTMQKKSVKDKLVHQEIPQLLLIY